MKLLFIQHGSRVRYTKEGKPYVDGNYNNSVWKRYRSYCDELHVVLRRVEEKFEEEELKKKMNEIDESILNLVTVPDVYSPKKNFLSLKVRKEIDDTIKREVELADKVILRSAGDFYTDIALKYCLKFNKPYLIEAVGFPFASFWYHSTFGKIIAYQIDKKFKKAIKNSSYVLYVTEDALQKKYPSKGKILGCSDVELTEFSFTSDEIRNKKSEKDYNKIVLGTAAFLNVNWKGQKDVIKSLAELKKQGITNFEYQLVGAGDPSSLINLAQKLNVEDMIKVIGPLPHNEVFSWLDNLDIYVQPSYQEGLCRSIVEAMSRGCAVVCSDVGGNYELIDSEYIYKKGNIKQLSKVLASINKDMIVNQSVQNYEKSKHYEKESLDKKRNEFYLDFAKK